MSTASVSSADASPAGIFARLWDSNSAHLSADLARHILGLTFPERDRERMHELATKNAGGKITPAELQELDTFIQAADLLALLQSKARQFLKQEAGSRNGDE